MSIAWYDGIVVGVDGSAESLAALDWAAHAAELHEARLTVVATYGVPIGRDPGVGGLIGEMRDQAGRAAEAARAWLVEHRPEDEDVEVLVTSGDAARELSRRSRTCGLVVVGRRGLGKLDRMVLGSTSSTLAAIAPGAVAVVPAGATTADPRRIRVGVGREDEPDVLGAAFAEADVRGCALEVLHVTSADTYSAVPPELDPVAASWREAATADLADRVARWSEKYPRVTCTIVIRRGNPAPALLSGLTPEDLLVVGGRRHQAVMGRMLRSVPDAVLRAAPCTVLVGHAHRRPSA
ncbi:universal stress protein [Myceligenerans salitolerans]|uniref:Universal stress protein n=1 Tax=Myceligenerans salitolerans TaxID=1230528 RepID=A0ABS3IFB9_9MICO|nr:universal stress protein [Myceligenerans salitolerans]MBO0610727.1 universal stress protein [Myceligenerans salitolerans]